MHLLSICRCKRNSYITSIPIDFVLPKLLNYLAFQSFDLELPDEGYSRNVHGEHKIYGY
jgi:hypothetical protein